MKMNETNIEGVSLKPLKKIPDERGSIYHMLRCDDPLFEEFGEIYFSVVYPQVIKGWHIHQKMTLNYAVISGMIKLVLYDNRDDSTTRGNIMELFLGDENYCLVKIPPMVWNGFKGVGENKSIIANLATIPHDPDEIVRKDPFTKDIPYNWKIKYE
jgi:dTDP-4-dehydrorhamnose 3,5-epimerase